MRKLTLNLAAIAACALSFVFSADVNARQTQAGSSNQASSGGQSSSTQTSNGSTANSQQDQQPAPAAAVSNGPVTGIFSGFLSSVVEGHSTLQYGFSASESAIVDPTGAGGSTDVFALTSVSGNLSINKIGRRNNLAFSVTGGGLLYDTMSSLDSGMGGISFGDSIQFRRWTLQIGDQIYYLPQTPFGFSGGLLNGFGLGGLGGISVPPTVQTPPNTIVSAQNPEITESLGAQANVSLSARTTFTVSAGYGITDYIHGGELRSSGFNFGAGYNYQFTARDTIGLQAGVTISDYGAGTNSIGTYGGSVNYGHRFTNRLAFQAGGGAIDYGYSSPSGGGRISNVSYTANAGLSYQLGRNALQASVLHDVYNGGGYLYGGIQTFVQGGASRQITRFWMISGGVGFGKASGLSGTPTSNESYQTVYASASLARELNPYASVYFQGVALHQGLNPQGCVVGLPCAGGFNQYVVSAGLSWNFRPRPLD